MTQLLHISDTHLGKRQYGLEFRENDIYTTFNELIDIAIKEHVDAVIHTGDLFDVNDPPNRAEVEAVKALKKVKEKNIPFIIIAGDHDSPKRYFSLYPQKLLEEFDLIKFLHKSDTPYKINDVYIYGISHVPNINKERLKEILSKIKPESKKSVLMLHQGVREILPYEGAWQLELGDLPRSFLYYALGHFHSRRVFNLDGGRIVEVAGSPDIIREEEIEGFQKEGKGATLIDFTGDLPSIQKINVEIRKQIVEEIDTTKIDDEISRVIGKIRNIKSDLDRAILHIILKGINLPQDHLNKKLKNLEPYVAYWRIYKNQTENQQYKNVEIPSNSSIDNLIVEYLTKVENFSKEEASVVLDIIKHADNDDYVKDALKKMLGVE